MKGLQTAPVANTESEITLVYLHCYIDNVVNRNGNFILFFYVFVLYTHVGPASFCIFLNWCYRKFSKDCSCMLQLYAMLSLEVYMQELSIDYLLIIGVDVAAD